MDKRLRYACNALANWIEDAADRAVSWLRAKGERPRRPRPLVFPSPLWLQMVDMQDRMIRAMAPRIAREILRDIPNVYVAEMVGETIKIRIPTDG